jgi:hypothetical protein
MAVNNLQEVLKVEPKLIPFLWRCVAEGLCQLAAASSDERRKIRCRAVTLKNQKVQRRGSLPETIERQAWACPR